MLCSTRLCLLSYHSALVSRSSEKSVRNTPPSSNVDRSQLEIIPLPNANFSASAPPFLNPTEWQATRQHLNLLDQDLLLPHGQTGLAQNTLQRLVPFLDKSKLTQ